MTNPTRRRGSRGGVGGHEPQARIIARAQRAWDLSARGWTQREIADDLNVSQPAISKILQRKAAEETAALRDAREGQRARLLAKEAVLYREAMRAYERSQEKQTRQRQRETVGTDGKPGATTREAEVLDRDGDPRFLEQAGRSLERQSRLLGLDRDRRHAQSGTDGDTGTARRRLASGLARLATGQGAGPVAGDSE